jgi:hypothetical protein
MKTPEKSRFGKLIAYLVDTQGKGTRVGEVRITNCVSTELAWAVREVSATQGLNARAKSDRTYHLLISMRSGENPDPETLQKIEGRFCRELGFDEHQRISVVHRDTDNLHIHVAINKIHPQKLTLHDPIQDYKTRSKLAAVLENELGLARDRHERAARKGHDMEAKTGLESFETWLRERAQHLVDATSWAELHGIASAYGVTLKLRANGFVFGDEEQGIFVKASAVHRLLSRAELEKRLGTFIDRDGIQIAEKERKERYEKRPVFKKYNQSVLWRQYQTQRDLRSATNEAKLLHTRLTRVQRISDAKANARAKRRVIRLTLKGAARMAAYSVINLELARAIRAINEDFAEKRRAYWKNAGQESWTDWLRRQAEAGRQDALEALRAASRGRQVTKQGTVMLQVGEHEIRDDGERLFTNDTVPDEVILVMLHRTLERYGPRIATHGTEEFQLRIGRVAGANHLDVIFDRSAVEDARKTARALAPVPISRAAQQYIAERNSKRDKIADIAPHRLWQTADAGTLDFVGLRVVDNQDLLLLSNRAETLVLPITPTQRAALAQQRRGIPITISAQLLVQPHTQDLSL